ncbi:MAG TPA: trypsin-like peptidase domain-containing protein [Spirochaetia bacterium]|nr:trypsin-like peptidase domain-containing protein [Spirochaetia bacterium]
MKLYSRMQVLIFSGICVSVALFVASVFGFVRLPWTPSYQENTIYTDSLKGNSTPVLEGMSAQFDDRVKSLDTSQYSTDELENILIYKKYNEAVVNITSISFSYNWFLEPVPEEGTGSGSIIDKNGIVLTNYHVIKGAKELHITLADGSDFKGEVVGADPENDLAVIKFNPAGKVLTTVAFGSSSNLLVGQKVIAIGNPFALERTLTTGIVSGLGRPVKTGEGIIIKEMIQTDASINPGNSGGPLLNSQGEIIGINTMIYSPSGGSVGIGFAVPVDTARRILPDLMQFGGVRRGWIDITPVQLFPQLVRYANLPISNGILVSEITPRSLAEKAGLRGGDKSRAVRAGRTVFYLGGDIIIEVDGTPIKSLMDLYSALEDNKPGEVVEIKIMRDGTQKTLKVTLSERS